MMKKMNVVFFVILFTFVLSACGGVESTKTDDTGNDSNNENSSNVSDEIQEITIKLSHEVPEGHVKHKASSVVKEYIEKESNGKIKFEIFPNNSLFDSTNQYQNLASNNVQFIIPDMSKLVESNPAFNIPSVPFLFDDNEAALKFWEGEKGQEVLKSLEKDGVLGLDIWPNGIKHIMNGERPISTPEDLKGLKFRTQGGQLLSDVYKTFDASSQTMSFGDVYTALETGVIDGLDNTFGALDSAKLDEVQKYLTVTGHNRVDYAVLTNTEFWNSLNEPTKKIVSDGIAEGSAFAKANAVKLNDEAFENIKERGNVEIIELTPEQIDVFRDALQPLYDKWTPTIGEDVIEAAKEANN